MADPLKNSQVGFARAERMEGYTGEIARRGKTHGVPQPGGKFVEGVREVVVERRSSVVIEGLLGDEQREQFALAHLHGGGIFTE